MLRISRLIDGAINRIGTAAAWAVFPLIAVVLIDVVSRRVFNQATAWGHETAYMIYGFLWVMGIAYTLLHKAHTRIDVFVLRLPEKPRLMIDLLGFLVFFGVFAVVFVLEGFEFARMAWAKMETSGSTAWNPPLYPLKTVLPVGFVLLLVQGISECIKEAGLLVKGRKSS